MRTREDYTTVSVVVTGVRPDSFFAYRADDDDHLESNFPRSTLHYSSDQELAARMNLPMETTLQIATWILKRKDWL